MSIQFLRRVFLLVLCVATTGAPAAIAERRTFNGIGEGPIADGPAACDAYGAPLDVTFSVSGMVAPLGSVRVLIDFAPAHTWVGDLDVVLFAPGGASQVLFSRTGATTPTAGGDSSDADGPYTFVDHFDESGSGDWWTVATASGSTTALPAGRYRTSVGGESLSGGPATLMNPTFANLTTAQINGTWTLRFRDHCQSDVGTVATTQLSLANPTVLDFDGDGATDYVVVRNTGGGPTGAVTWIASVPPSPLVFYDGFESGNLAAWSASSPLSRQN